MDLTIDRIWKIEVEGGGKKQIFIKKKSLVFIAPACVVITEEGWLCW